MYLSYVQGQLDRNGVRLNGAVELPKIALQISCAPLLIIQLGSFGTNPIQEEVNGSLPMPLFGFWIRRDAVECEAFGVPEYKIEEHVSRKFRVVYLNLTAGGGLTQYT